MIKRVKYIEKLDKRDWNSIEKDKDFEKQYPQKKRLDLKQANGKVFCYQMNTRGWTVLRQTRYLGRRQCCQNEQWQTVHESIYDEY